MTTQPTQPPLPWITDLALRLRTCLCEDLVQHGRPTCWCGLYPGTEVPWEFCGECSSGRCGMGYVQVTAAYPSTEFPVVDSDATCRAPLAYEMTLGVVRCVPVADDDGALPSEGDILPSAMVLLDDQQSLVRAVACCMAKVEHVMGTWEPVGPQGGCVGGQITVVVTP